MQTIRRVLNKDQVSEALYMHHQHPLGGHMGYHNTLFKLANHYYWENMTKDVQNYVKKCSRCQSTGPAKHNELLHPIPTSSKPFFQWALDVKHISTSKNGYRYIVAGIDYLTKWVEARALKFQTASEIALFIYEDIICRHGAPHTIITDNGKPFIGDLIKKVCLHYKIHHKTISVGNSQANGLIEKFNSTLGAIGHEAKTPYDLFMDIPIETNSASFQNQLNVRAAKELLSLKQIREDAADFIQKSQKNQKKAIDKKINNTKREWKPPFRTGDIVMMYVGRKPNSWGGKISDNWKGKYIIHQSLGKGTYLIKEFNVTNTKLRRIHGNKLKLLQMPDVFWIDLAKKTIV